MKKIFTLGALGLLASFGAQAQVTLDGRIMASEIGSGLNQYKSMGQMTNPRGFGDWGIKEAFISEDANYIYVAIHGTVENNGNSFQIYFNAVGPTQVGLPACQPLPAALSASGDPTSFANMTAAMDMEVDAAVAYSVRGSAGGVIGTPQFETCDYRPATSATPASVVQGTMTNDGTAANFLGGALRAAYRDSPAPTPPASSPGGVLSTNTNEGLEFAVAKAAYSLTAGSELQVFVLMNNGDGGFLSTDFIPQDPTATGTNLGTAPDFCLDVAGTQYVRYIVGTGLITGLKKVDAGSFNFSVAPNPINGVDAAVNFTLSKPEAATVVVTDMLGRQVATLANGTLPAGEQRLTLKSANLAAGQYIVKLQFGDKVATRKVAVQ